MKSRILRPRNPALSAPPGTVTPPPGAVTPLIRLMAYDNDQLVEQVIQSADEVRPHLNKWPVLWVDVDGLADAHLIQELGEMFGLHPLALEDVVHTHQRSKVEDYDTNIFMVTRMVNPVEKGEKLEQVGLFLGKNFVVSFQERPGDCFDPVRDRIRKGGRRTRLANADYLAYALLDALVDSYFPLLELYGDTLDELEDGVMEATGGNAIMTQIHETKRMLYGLRHVIWPLRDALSLLSQEHDLISDDTRFFLRDCQDHVMQQLDILENYRERAAGLTDLHLSVISMRMNEVMKVLTIIATVFMPLTFIVGVYGMNFDTSLPGNMPELHWPFAYPALWGVMIVMAAGMMAFFYRMGWISLGKKEGDDET